VAAARQDQPNRYCPVDHASRCLYYRILSRTPHTPISILQHDGPRRYILCVTV
jgi:hypothetical protein